MIAPGFSSSSQNALLPGWPFRHPPILCRRTEIRPRAPAGRHRGRQGERRLQGTEEGDRRSADPAAGGRGHPEGADRPRSRDLAHERLPCPGGWRWRRRQGRAACVTNGDVSHLARQAEPAPPSGPTGPSLGSHGRHIAAPKATALCTQPGPARGWCQTQNRGNMSGFLDEIAGSWRSTPYCYTQNCGRDLARLPAGGRKGI